YGEYGTTFKGKIYDSGGSDPSIKTGWIQGSVGDTNGDGYSDVFLPYVFFTENVWPIDDRFDPGWLVVSGGAYGPRDDNSADDMGWLGTYYTSNPDIPSVAYPMASSLYNSVYA